MLAADHNTRNIGLDLVRAAAISLVLLCHWSGAASLWCGFQWPPIVAAMSGFLGVELFFALSGFLIGRLLLELLERNASLLGWWRFMLRRWLRTLPLYLLCLAGLALSWPPAGSLSSHLLVYGTLTQNLLWPMPKENWFSVSWSLGVEEWFYLLFSALLIGSVAITGRRKACIWGVIALFVAIPTLLRWQVIGLVEGGEHVRDVTLLRLDAITYGVAVATLFPDRSPAMRRPALLAATGLAILVEQWFQPFSLAWVPPHAFQVFFFTAPSLAFSLCLPAASRIWRLPTALAWVARRLSAHAYALYLVHLTLLDMITVGQARLGLTGATCIAISVVAIFGLSHALHHWFEAPIMARRPQQFPVSCAAAKARSARPSAPSTRLSPSAS